MAYNSFSFRKLAKEYQVPYKIVELGLGSAERIKPSEHLMLDLEEARLLPIYSEKAKSELMITPILKEIRRIHNHAFTIFSGYSLDIDSELTGICDYIIARVPAAIEVEAPIFCLVESKNKAPEEGFAQCAAEMYAAFLFNEQEKNPVSCIYGCVTNAFDWIFLKLENKTIFVDQSRYNVEDIELLLGVLYNVLN